MAPLSSVGPFRTAVVAATKMTFTHRGNVDDETTQLTRHVETTPSPLKRQNFARSVNYLREESLIIIPRANLPLSGLDSRGTVPTNFGHHARYWWITSSFDAPPERKSSDLECSASWWVAGLGK